MERVDSANPEKEQERNSLRSPVLNIAAYCLFGNRDRDDDKLQKSLQVESQVQQTEALLSAAERSIAFNLIVFIIFFIIFMILLLLASKSWRAYSVAVFFSCVKTALPVTMTIANFGTVQFVLAQYWDFFKKHFFTS